MENRLKEFRKRRGLTQTELARKIGTFQSNISEWETKSPPGNYSTRQKLAEALGTTPAVLFDGLPEEYVFPPSRLPVDPEVMKRIADVVGIDPEKAEEVMKRVVGVSGISPQETEEQEEEGEQEQEELPGKVNVVWVPLLGQISAGRPLFSEENIEGYYPAPDMRGVGDGFYYLKVKGDCLNGEGIADGDWVLVDSNRKEPNNGEVVVVAVNHEAELRIFYRHNNQVLLVAANPSYQPIIVQKNDNVEVKGVVVYSARWR